MQSSTIKININEAKLAQAANRILDSSTRTQIQQLFAETIDPWTPFLTGQLASDITVDEEGVTYNVEYAAEKYYGTVYTKTEHPLATSHWDEVAMQSEREAFELKVKALLEERIRQLYG